MPSWPRLSVSGENNPFHQSSIVIYIQVISFKVNDKRPDALLTLFSPDGSAFLFVSPVSTGPQSPYICTNATNTVGHL